MTKCQYVQTEPNIWICSVCGHRAKTSHQPSRNCGTAPHRPQPTPAANRPPTPDKDPHARENEYRVNTPFCIHRGDVIEAHQPCLLCGAKHEIYDVYTCDVFGKCSLGKRAQGLAICAGCERLETPAPSPVPSPNTPAEPSPVVFAAAPDRHLIYHVWPCASNQAWRWNLEQLLSRIELFNGVRTIGVATGPGAETLATVQKMFAGVRIDNWIEAPNDPVAGEGATFVKMMQTLPRDGVTFYGHAKGVKYHPKAEHADATIRWAKLLYQVSLDHWTEVERQLSDFPITGAFKRYGDHDRAFNHRWHYSGTFFWFRNADIFNLRWNHIERNFYGCIEAWPGSLMPAQQAGCLFGDNAGFLYLDHDLSAQETAYQTWPALSDRSPGNAVSDRQFFRQEQQRGFTTHLWPRLVEIHQAGADAVELLRCTTVLELGSGLGAFLVAAPESGLDARGIGISQLERDFAISKGVDPDAYQLADLTTYRIPQPVDAIYCVEVFEHLTDAELDPICRQLADNCRWFYFSSTPDDRDREWGHVNVKTRDEWIAFFARYGLHFSHDDTSVVPWGMVFQPPHSPP